MGKEAPVAFERKFSGDGRFSFKRFGHAWAGADTYFAQMCAAEGVKRILGWPDGAAMQVGETAATQTAGTCSVAILYGEEGSSHWIFGHIMARHGLPWSQAMIDAAPGIVGRASLALIGAGAYDSDFDAEFRKEQIDTLLAQARTYHIDLAKPRIATYWNDVPNSSIDVIARVSERGLERAHVIHVLE